MNDQEKSIETLLTGFWLSDAANISAFVFYNFTDLNWAGFYFWDGTNLTLGPFQGKVACDTIAPGRGVCGSSFQTKKILNIPDVHAFPGHIACDSESRSELVIPLIIHGQCIGVLDIDSPKLNRFDESTQNSLITISSIFINKIKHHGVTGGLWSCKTY